MLIARGLGLPGRVSARQPGPCDDRGMSRPRVLAIIQAGGAGGRMDVLTRERAKPALPFAGVYQLVDFPLSNLAHSGVTDVWLSLQFQGATLEEQVANGRPWDLDRDRGGLRLLMPEQGTGSLDEEGFAQGNADGLFRIRAQIARGAGRRRRAQRRPRLPPRLHRGRRRPPRRRRRVHRRHHRGAARGGRRPRRRRRRRRGPGDRLRLQARGPGDGHDRGRDHRLRPARAGRRCSRSCTASSAPTATRATPGSATSATTSSRGWSSAARRTPGRSSGYWRDVGQPHHYLQAHQDVLTDDLGILDEPGWPILTRQPQRVPGPGARGRPGRGQPAQPGSRVAGTVVRSVIGPGVVVEAGAEVHDSVVFADSVVRAGSRVHWSVVDARCASGRTRGSGTRTPTAPATRRRDAGRPGIGGRGGRRSSPPARGWSPAPPPERSRPRA